MDDQKFLNYCMAHVETPRAGFMPEQLYRLFKLAGDPAGGNWDKAPQGHIESFSDQRYFIMDRVKKARELMG